jgi:hypothetical protein
MMPKHLPDQQACEYPNHKIQEYFHVPKLLIVLSLVDVQTIVFHKSPPPAQVR